MKFWVQTTCYPLKTKFVFLFCLCPSKKQVNVRKTLIKIWYISSFTIRTNDDRKLELQIQWICVNFIVLYYYFRMKVQYSSFSLFIICHWVIFCWENSVCICKNHSLIKNLATPFQRAITTLLQYLPIESFAAESQIVRGKFVSRVSFTTTTQHFQTPEFLFENTKLSLVMVPLCLLQHVWGKNSDYISTKTIGTVFWPQLLPLCFHFRSFTVFEFLLGKSELEWIGVHFQQFELVYVTEFSEKVAVQFKHSEFCISQNEKPDNDWFFVLSLSFDEINFIYCIVHVI